MSAYLQVIERHARLVLAVTLAITVLFAVQLPKLSEDSNPYLLPESHPARESIKNLQKEFSGTYDAALIVVVKQDGVFNRNTLDAVLDITRAVRRLSLVSAGDRQQLQNMADRLANRPEAAPMLPVLQRMLVDGLDVNDAPAASSLLTLPGAASLSAAERQFLRFLPGRLAPIKDVSGLAGTENLTARDHMLHVQRSLHDKTTPPEIVRQEVMGNTLMHTAVVSGDGRIAVIAAELDLRAEDSEGQMRAQRALQLIVAAQRTANPAVADEVYIAGTPIFMAEQARLMNHDLEVLLPAVLLVVALVLILHFRRPLGVLLPLLNVTLSTVWTLGLMAWLRVPIDLITSVLPVFLITVCGADALHLLNEFYAQRRRGLSHARATRESLRLLISPVVLTTITTVIGFLFATATQIENIRHFGMFMAFGLVAAQLISVTFIPACLCCVPSRQPDGQGVPQRRHSHNLLGRLLTAALRPVIAHRRGAGAAFLLVLGVAGWSASRIHVEDEGVSYFLPDNPVRVADTFINTRSVGTSPGWIVIDSGHPRGAIDLATLRFIDELDQWLQGQAHVRYTYSIAKYIRRIQTVLHDDDPAWDRLPADTETLPPRPDAASPAPVVVSGADLVNEALVMYENSGGKDLQNVLNGDYAKAVTLFTLSTTKASEYRSMLEQLDAWVETHRPKGVRVSVAGTPVIWSSVLDEILQGQLLSFFMAYAVVAVVLMGWLRSLRRGLVSSLPLAATMVLYFGAMSALDIDLNIGTALISYLLVGIVDYSVHFMHRVSEYHRTGHTADESVLHAAEHAGSSIFFNILLFSLGFLTLLASEFTPLRHLGLLVALSLLISGLMSLFLISLLAPWFLQRTHPRAPAASQ